MATTEAPTSEIGAGSSSGSVSGGSLGTLGWGAYVDDAERVPELKWPQSVNEYGRMRNDSQISALMMGHTLPIRRYTYRVDPNGAADEVVAKLTEDVGLPVLGSDEEVDDTDSNFNHDDNLRHALLALVYGSLFGEVVGHVDDEGWWRLDKVAPRMPTTLASIETEDDGGLKGIRQNIRRKGVGRGPLGQGNLGGMGAPLIPVDRLVAFTWEREGANWAGRSMLRSLYANWLIKQRLIRVDATKHERNGMGVPVTKTTSEGVGRRALAAAARMATRLRSGNNSGISLPFGIDMKLMGVEGNLPDTLASIKYHDEAMARALLMMFLQLGQTETGSRALGDSFIDFFDLALRSVAGWYCTTMTKYVFRKWVVWNVGPDSPTPKLVFDPLPADLAVADLKSLIDSGAVVVDDEVRSWVRGRYNIPRSTSPTPAPAPVPVATPAAASGRRYGKKLTGTGRRLFAADEGSINLPDRALRRQPMAFELQAAVDFAQLDDDFEAAVDTLVAQWGEVRTAHTNELVDIIAQIDPADLSALSEIEAESGQGADLIAEVMHDVADKGAEGAVQEAKAQGQASASKPDLSDLKSQLSERAAAIDVLLTRSLSEAAARKATALAGGALAADDIANEVRTYLDGLSDTYLHDQFTGAVTQAQNSGRRTVLLAEEPESVYASELLDKNTCTNCKSVDGREYGDVAAAEEDYPSGGFKDCLGGPKCRGTLVGVYEESST